MCKKIIAIVAVVLSTGHLASAQDASELSRAAYTILKENCHECHGLDTQGNFSNVLDHSLLLASPSAESDELPLVTPNDLQRSKLWLLIKGNVMPLGEEDGLDEDSKDTIRRWIEAGAPKFELEETRRETVSFDEAMKAVERHLSDQSPRERRFQRYFTLRHFWNNPAVTNKQIRLYRAGLVKGLNSLSTQSAIIQPEQVDDSGTIYAIDLREFRWEVPGFWRQILQSYPYGVKPTSAGGWIERRTIEVYEDVVDEIGPDVLGIPVIRADWFIAKAMRAPLYDQFLSLPDTLAKLETQLGVDRVDDFRKNRLRRAGFAQSGISRQSRLVDRHPSNRGGYWISYDFSSSAQKSNPIRFPLGPKFENHPHENMAFEAAGSEIIFPLNNRLHGYMIVKEDGGKIPKAPINIVADKTEISGSPEIVNGLSCIGCHRTGIQNFRDTIRESFSINNNGALARIDGLYAEKSEMERLIKEDRASYLQALQSTIGRYLQVEEDEGRSIEEFPEPVSALVRVYHQDISREYLAYELGVKPEIVDANVANSLANLGLGPLRKGVDGAVDRFAIEAADGGISVFQQSAAALRLGVPISP